MGTKTWDEENRRIEFYWIDLTAEEILASKPNITKIPVFTENKEKKELANVYSRDCFHITNGAKTN